MTDDTTSGQRLIFGPITDTFEEWLVANRYTACAVLVDENTVRHCLPVLEKNLSIDLLPIQIPAGEQFKTIQTCEKIWTAMLGYGLHRGALLINLGGGVIGDMGGFVASTYKRGIDFVQIPTTLLAQVDASVGGKLGVDFEGIKNAVGLFRNPEAIYIDSRFLKTLPPRILKSGYAEVIKHALIKDKFLWRLLASVDELSELDWEAIIPRAIAIKSAIVKDDPFDHGVRNILNFGHTVGHGIESCFINVQRPLLHGEAVAAGMIIESEISRQKGLLPAADQKAINEVILKTFGKVPIEVSLLDAIYKYMLQDKKNQMDAISCSLLENIGSATYAIPISKTEILNAFEYYRNLKTFDQ